MTFGDNCVLCHVKKDRALTEISSMRNCESSHECRINVDEVKNSWGSSHGVLRQETRNNILKRLRSREIEMKKEW